MTTPNYVLPNGDIKAPIKGVFNAFIHASREHIKPHGGYDPTSDAFTDAQVEQCMANLFAMLSKARPRWEFIAERAYMRLRNGAVPYYDNFKVVQDGEVLGEIKHDWMRGDYRPIATNDRLRRARNRNPWTYSKDPKQLASIILKHFYPRTDEDILNAASNIATSAAYNVIRDANHKHTEYKRKLDTNAAAFILENWDKFVAFVPDNLTDTAHNFKESAAYMQDVMELDESSGHLGTSYTLYERGNRYLIRAKTPIGTADTEYTLDDMPEHIKAAYSLLKLASKGEFIPGVGVRVDEYTYYIIAKQGDTQ